jgi:hypothetical protein
MVTDDPAEFSLVSAGLAGSAGLATASTTKSHITFRNPIVGKFIAKPGPGTVIPQKNGRFGHSGDLPEPA